MAVSAIGGALGGVGLSHGVIGCLECCVCTAGIAKSFAVMPCCSVALGALACWHWPHVVQHSNDTDGAAPLMQTAEQAWLHGAENEGYFRNRRDKTGREAVPMMPTHAMELDKTHFIAWIELFKVTRGIGMPAVSWRCVAAVHPYVQFPALV